VDITFSSLLVTWCTNSLTFNNCTFCPHCIYVFCIYLRKNSDLCHLQHKLIGFYNRDKKCLLRGTNWVFKYSSLRFVFKGLRSNSNTLSYDRLLACLEKFIPENWLQMQKFIRMYSIHNLHLNVVSIKKDTLHYREIFDLLGCVCSVDW
jgi:hypothetical protein